VGALDSLERNRRQAIRTVLSRGRGRGHGGLHPIDLSDDQKNRKGNDDEIQNVIDKNAIIQSCSTGGLGRGNTGIVFASRRDLFQPFDKL